MKKILRYAMLCAAAVSIIGCDINKEPYEAQTADTIQGSPDGVEVATFGNYAKLKSWTDNWYRVIEYGSDDVALSGTTTDNLFYSYNYQHIPTNYRTNNFWNASYQIIGGTNKIITGVTEGESPKFDQYLGENYYLRAMIYFYLTNVFGRPYYQGESNLSVPLKLDNDYLNFPPRATVGEVYNQIVDDLTKAASLMTEDKANAYASKEAANALLSRVYLYMREYDKAIEHANKVIDSGKYSLVSTNDIGVYPRINPDNNNETIFTIKHLADIDYESNGWYTIGSMYANFQGSGWGEMYASSSFLRLVRQYPEDQRNNFIDPVENGSGEMWALYVDDNTNYAHKVISYDEDTDNYFYDNAGTTTYLTKSTNEYGNTEYFLEEGGKSYSAFIQEAMTDRNGYPKFYILKCSGQDEQAHLWSPVISRLAEVYLNKAEANAHLGNDTEALADINMIRERAGIPTEGLYSEGNLPTGKSVVDVVLEERRLELAWEGHRKFDIFRNGLTLDRNYPGTHLTGAEPLYEVPATHPRVVDYIPESQRLIQGNLEQNP
ncbi:RagB/SusD family nutrient uptake outer membrane protein [Limibacter armeniacum]|uniref:RagB/SusD family nutrient uptake outer membrane protein n=1 Tax=Limibacter armeniacum TaxID=466084 RepID=UPI002FE51FAB